MKPSTSIDLTKLKARWEQQAKRIDALSLRERAILFLSIVAVLAALFDFFVLSPQSARAKLRSEAQAKQAAEVGQLRQQFVAISQSGANTPAAQLQAQLEAARAERESLDGALRNAGAVNPTEGLAVVLQRLLARQPGLVLERVALLEDTPVTLPSDAASAPAAATAAPPAMPGMRWQGVELQVQGRYADIQRYLQALEAELPSLRWGEMRLSSERPGEAPRLVAQIHLLKVQP